jgi:hypothetical protein
MISSASSVPLRFKVLGLVRRDPGDQNQWYGFLVEKKIFWMLFIVLGLIMDVALPLWWSLALTLPLLVLCWWVAYRSGWFQ